MTPDVLSDVDPRAEMPAQMPARPERVRGAMTPRERRRKLLLLALLVLLVALLSYSAYYFSLNRRLPIPGVAPREAALEPPEYLFSITGSGANQLMNPVGVTIGEDGRVYIVDFDRRRISVFNRNGKFLFAFSKIADGTNPELLSPVHLATDAKGNIWVTDRALRAIYIFTPNGAYLRKFVPDGKKDFQWSPLALAFDSQGGVKVTDVGSSEKHRVLYFDASGKLVKQIGSTARVNNAEESPGGFYFPNGIAVAKNGDVYVSDGDNRRVQVLDKNGTFKQFVATSGIPRGTAIDDKSRLFVADALAHQVDIYSLKGENLTSFGEQGFGPGQFNYANDVAVGGNRIFVSDRRNNQVQVWGWPSGILPPIKPPSTPLGWLACLSPLLLLPLLLLARRRRVMVTEDFVDAMIALGKVSMLGERRFRFVTPEEEHGRYAGRVVEGVNLERIIEPERHSASDARAIQDRLEIDENTAIRLAVARRTKGLGTENEELRGLAIMLEIPVFTSLEFVAQFGRDQE